MERRALLASAGSSLAALSGCFSPGEEQDDPPTEEEPIDDTPTPSPTTAAADVTVESVTQQYGYVGTNTDWINLVQPESRFVVAEVAVEGGGLAADQFAFATEDGKREPKQLNRFYRTDWLDDQWYEQGRERGLLLFDVPEDTDDDPQGLRWPGGEWRPDETFVRRWRTPRQPMAATLDVPAEHDGESPPPMAVEVTNRGDAEGQFFGVLNRNGPSYAHAPAERLSEFVAAGETTTIPLDHAWYGPPPEENLGDGEPDVTYKLSWADGSASAEIRLR